MPIIKIPTNPSLGGVVFVRNFESHLVGGFGFLFRSWRPLITPQKTISQAPVIFNKLGGLDFWETLRDQLT